MAPIDPAHLLKALDPLLHDDCGIRETSASQFSSLMKKFSKKLVSRCVYVNVMKVTHTDVLEKLLDQGGWCTINAWLADAKETRNQFFLIKLLELCKLLPMTVGRLKENNTPKIVKSLAKFDNEYIQTLSQELVIKWMVIIKGGSSDSDVTVENNTEKKTKSKSSKVSKKSGKKDSPSKKRKGEKLNEVTKVKGAKKNSIAKSPSPVNEIVKEVLKPEPIVSKVQIVPKKLKFNKLKRTSSESNIPINEDTTTAKSHLKSEEPFPKKAKLDRLKKPVNKKLSLAQDNFLDDVKIELKPDLSPKKVQTERPKTVKSFGGKFRATGLETVAPLPKKIPKKVPTVNKSEAAAVAKNAVVKRLNSTVPERITEKKIKPESLLNISETPTQAGGVKLIPAKPKPIHILQESASFMDALVAQPEPPVRRKKKPSPRTIIKPALNAPPTPPPVSPPVKPKLQFYKDTLEEESSVKTEEKAKDDAKDDKESSDAKPPTQDDASEPVKPEENTNDAVIETENKVTSPTDTAPSDNTTTNEEISKDTIKLEIKEEEPERIYPGGLRPILSHSRKHRPKKNVKWVDDDNLKQMHYFELDETERVNVLRSNHMFGDFKSIEAKREREFFELAKRQAGDKMEEMIPWWTSPIVVKIPPLPVEPGYLSVEKGIQQIRHQSVLQAIYFTKNLIPESPQEPDSESGPPIEPKIIPLDEENMLGSVIDYTAHKMPTPATSLPEVLSTLMNLPVSRPLNQPEQQPPPNPMPYPPNTMSPTSPYDPGEPVLQQVPTTMPKPMPPPMGMNPPIFNNPRLPMMEQDPNIGAMQNMPNNWNNVDPNLMMQETPPFFPPGMFPPVNPFPPMMEQNLGPISMSRANNNNHNNNNNNSNNMRRMRGGGRMMAGVGPPMQLPLPRVGGPRRGVPHVPCRHFALGSCRFGAKCSFLHPGINGPPL